MSDQLQKISLVTGGTSGIGFATAEELTRRGHLVLLHGRTKAKAEEAKKRILEEHLPAPAGHASAGGEVQIIHAELGQPKQIEAMAKAVLADYPRIDNLINNAGIWNSTLELDERGVEKVLAVNHLAYAQLTYLLMPALKAAPDGRIINVASDSHRQIKGMFWDDLNLTNNYHGLKSYAQSKLANVLFTYEYERRRSEGDPLIFAVQPGLVRTDIGLKGNKWLHRFAWRVRRRMSGNKTPLEGASSNIFLATEADIDAHSGKYFDDCKPKKSFSSSYDEEEARKLWEWTLSQLGINNFFVA
ncbi:MAG: SDR family NAD(P)-dependent oxidoreductase [Bacteroidota bacterium]